MEPVYISWQVVVTIGDSMASSTCINSIPTLDYTHSTIYFPLEHSESPLGFVLYLIEANKKWHHHWNLFFLLYDSRSTSRNSSTGSSAPRFSFLFHSFNFIVSIYSMQSHWNHRNQPSLHTYRTRPTPEENQKTREKILARLSNSFNLIRRYYPLVATTIDRIGSCWVVGCWQMAVMKENERLHQQGL